MYHFETLLHEQHADYVLQQVNEIVAKVQNFHDQSLLNGCSQLEAAEAAYDVFSKELLTVDPMDRDGVRDAAMEALVIDWRDV